MFKRLGLDKGVKKKKKKKKKSKREFIDGRKQDSWRISNR